MRRNILIGILVCVASVFIVERLTGRASETPSSMQLAVGDLLNGDMDTPKPLRADYISLTPAKSWALAASAPLTERNNEGHKTLGGVPLTEAWAQSKRDILYSSWGVNSKARMLEALDFLRKEGDRAQFKTKGDYVSGLNEKGYQALLEKFQNSPNDLHQAEMLKKYYGKYSANYLLAWDYVRYINLCRWGYVAEYLSEAEAWERIMAAALELQKNYRSWKEMGEAFLFGREFWSYSEMQKNGQLYTDAQQRLLDDAQSPWNKYNWNLSLSE